MWLVLILLSINTGLIDSFYSFKEKNDDYYTHPNESENREKITTALKYKEIKECVQYNGEDKS